MSFLITATTPPHAAPVGGNWQGIAPLGQGPGGDAPMQLDGGNETFSDTSGKILIPAANLVLGSRTAVILITGQSYAANMPATDPYAQASRYTPHGLVYQLNPFDGQFYGATDPLVGTSGVGGTMWTRLADDLIAAGTYDRVVLVPTAVGGSSITQWVPGGAYARKLDLTLRELQDAGVAPTHVVWEQGIADSATMSPATYGADFSAILSHLRSHGVTAPVYTAINSLSGGALDGNQTVASAQAAFATEQRYLSTDLFNQGVLAGVNFDELPASLYSQDGHFTSSGLDEAGSEWAAYLAPIPVVAPTSVGLVARAADGRLATGLVDGSASLIPTALPENFTRDWHLVGVSDGENLLFQLGVYDQVQAQLVQHGGAAGGGVLTNQLPGYAVVGLGDFNNDSHTDLIYSSPNAQPIVQLTDGGMVCCGGGAVGGPYANSGYALVGTVQSRSWTQTDLVWRDVATGITQVQFVNNSLDAVGGGQLTACPYDANWTLLGSGDFRHTGRLDDLVWEQPATGAVQVQFLDGITSVGGGILDGSPFDSSWRAVGVQEGMLLYQRQTDGILEHVTVDHNMVTGGGEYDITNSGSFAVNALFGNHQFV